MATRESILQEPHRAGPEHGLERLIFFSDAVFAIAITLLIIDLHVPELPRSAGDRDYLIALLNLTPAFLGFFISFFVIGAFWAGHHRSFACARRWDQRLFLPNLMLLCAVAAMPFFTALSSVGIGHRVPITFYCGWMLVTALLNINLQRFVLAPPVVDETILPDRIHAQKRRGYAVALGAGSATLLGFLPALCRPGRAGDDPAMAPATRPHGSQVGTYWEHFAGYL